MAQEISWEIREYAEELYITGGYTYEEVARATEVSVSQLKRWGSDGDWSDRKKEYRRALSDIKRKTVLLKRDLLDKAMNSLDPQSVYAFSSIAQATKAEKTETAPVIKEEFPDKNFETPGDAVDALSEAINKKITRMVSVPGELDFKALQDLKKAWDMLEQMRAKYSPEQDRGRILKAEEIKEIREQLRL